MSFGRAANAVAAYATWPAQLGSLKKRLWSLFPPRRTGRSVSWLSMFRTDSSKMSSSMYEPLPAYEPPPASFDVCNLFRIKSFLVRQVARKML